MAHQPRITTIVDFKTSIGLINGGKVPKGYKSNSTLQSMIDGTLDRNYPKRPPRGTVLSNADCLKYFGNINTNYKYINVPIPGFTDAFKLQKQKLASNSELSFCLGGKYYYDYAGKIEYGSMAFHKDVVESAEKLFDTWVKYGIHETFMYHSGSWVKRDMRGSDKPSLHSYGIAFDINATMNSFNTIPAKYGMYGNLYEAAKIAKEVGWYWGGWFFDGMHFQFDRKPNTQIVVPDDITVDKNSARSDNDIGTDYNDNGDNITEDASFENSSEQVFEKLNAYILNGEGAASSVDSPVGSGNKSEDGTKTEKPKDILKILTPTHAKNDIVIGADTYLNK